MSHYTGQIIEIQLERYKNASALLRLPSKAIPNPGQYLQTNQSGHSEEVLPVTLFPSSSNLRSEKTGDSPIPVIGHLPDHWEAGTNLALRGPLGRGYALPKGLKRLALITLDQSAARLLPLIPLALDLGAEITLFSNQGAHDLSLSVEVRPLEASQQARQWADFIAIDCPAERVEHIPESIGMDEDFPGQVSGQVLLTKPMPCGGLAQCGICAVKMGRKEILICENGPVVSLSEIISY